MQLRICVGRLLPSLLSCIKSLLYAVLDVLRRRLAYDRGWMNHSVEGCEQYAALHDQKHNDYDDDNSAHDCSNSEPSGQSG